jgi:hypothetical protein
MRCAIREEKHRDGRIERKGKEKCDNGHEAGRSKSPSQQKITVIKEKSKN